MCHTTDYNHHRSHRLNFTNFTVTLSLSAAPSYLPTTLSLLLHHHPPSFLTLHRTPSPPHSLHIAYTSRDPISLSHGLVFEVHLGELLLLNGAFRQDHALHWRVECKSAVNLTRFVGVKLTHVELRVWDDNDKTLLTNKVVVEKRKNGFKLGLVDIPEEREDDVEERDDDVDDDVEQESEILDSEMEVVRWAVDVGIWVGCLGLGLGLLLSRASVRSLKHRKLLL